MPKGRENVYVCQKCGGMTTTIDRDDGVTPFMLLCRATPACDGWSYSSGYPPGPRPPHVPAPTFEWYRASEKEATRMERMFPGSLSHHEKGGLFLREIAKTEAVEKA